MAERIPGIINSPFSVNGKLDPKSTLANMLSEWDMEPEPDPDIWKEKFYQQCEEQEVEDSRSEFLRLGMDPSDPFIAESITARGYYVGYALRQLDEYSSTLKPARPGRPSLDMYRCNIAFATLLWDWEKQGEAPLTTSFRRAAALLGPGVRGYHVHRAVLRVRRSVKDEASGTPIDEAAKQILALRPLARETQIRWVFEFLDREYGEEKHREQSPVSV